ncbi:GNAT family N-acetyltransferase [Alicyclobacillus fastidiosus]|uniref:GNAT family N-acetyltransferase n=1 Tax=Alicyclobacillus fastidiosus TaxID=392011 RepID=UPI0034DD915C
MSDLLPKLDGYFFVADKDGQIVGYIFATTHVSEGTAVPQGKKFLEIDEVYVHPDYRTDGIGHKLVDHLLAEARSHGITRSVVYSASKQWDKIVGFYEKHGFKMWFVQMYK